MFAAEDAGHIVRTRLAGITRAAGAAFDIAVIDVPTLHLDHRLDRQRLLEIVERIGPRLLVLDPLVRLHGVDENTVAEIAATFGLGPRCVWRRPGRRTRPWARGGIHSTAGEEQGAERGAGEVARRGPRARAAAPTERRTGRTGTLGKGRENTGRSAAAPRA